MRSPASNLQTSTSLRSELPLTALVITFNEEPNIERVLAALGWVPRVIVLDSGSTDETLSICARFANVEVVHRPFDSFASQCNYGLSLVRSEWCLSIDADYVLPSRTSEEIAHALTAGPGHSGYYARLAYCVNGQELKRAILPPRIVLFRTQRAHYVQDGHAHSLVVDGEVGKLQHPVQHDDRKSMKRWLNSQETYATQEAQKLLGKRWRELSWADRIRMTRVVAPWLVPAYYLFGKGGVFDGWAGIDYAAQRAIAELVLSVKLIEAKSVAAPFEKPDTR